MVNDQKPSLKRKRGEGAKQDIEARISGKLHHELHEIHHSCKKAKTFETQKLVKKLKQLREKDDDKAAIQDHESQLSFIKTIDHNKLAHTVVKTKCQKDKTLRDSEVVQASLKKEIGENVLEQPAAGTPQAKVQSRLLSHKIIAAQVASSIASIKAIVKPDLASAPPPTKKVRSESSEPQSKFRRVTDVRGDSTKVTLADSANSNEGEDEPSESGGNEGLGWESGTVDEYDDEDKQGVDEGDGGWESGSIHRSDSELEVDESDESRDNLQVEPPPKNGKAPASSSKSKGESTFLPSLAMGYMSGSDASDIDEPAGVELRKNRRGQRARRAIWEKKFGRNANHKKKEAEALKEKRARAFEKAQAKTHQRAMGMTRSDSGWGNKGNTHAAQVRSGAPAQSRPEAAKKPGNKPIHPSWEAKRKLKEKEGAGIVPSQGKKIKF